MLRRLVKTVTALAGAVVLILSLVSCAKEESSTPPPSGDTKQPAAQQVTYKCAGCGSTKTADASATAPSC